jgi:hypothetical protein
VQTDTAQGRAGVATGPAARGLVVLFLAGLYALALIASINGSSLWADEAFSAWLASHHTLAGFWNSLIHGDSSDLQMGLYYLYLFGWAHLFGASEYALRAANIPFICLFAYSLVWTSVRIFRSRIAWIAPAMLPFIWHYAAEARPYMAMLAFGSAAFAALLGFVESPRRHYSWICLVAILLGSGFHMLLLLALPPLALIAYARRDSPWREWLPAVRVLALPFLALAAYFAFTFARGTGYDYPNPGLRQMVSVFYELSGLAGFGPNRKFSLDFHAYLAPLAIGSVMLMAGLLLAARSLGKTALGAGAGLALVEVVILSAATGKQIDVRHLAALVPLFLFLLMAALARPTRTAAAGLVLLSAVWTIADIRLAMLPEYQKEDYRDAVAAALSIQRKTGAVIAIAADPVGAAYYGMDVEGAAPCYPIRQDCREAFNRVPWRANAAAAVEADRWPSSSIDAWLAALKARHTPVLVFAQRDRAHARSAWWPVLAADAGHSITHVHGFDLDVLN